MSTEEANKPYGVRTTQADSAGTRRYSVVGPSYVSVFGTSSEAETLAHEIADDLNTAFQRGVLLGRAEAARDAAALYPEVRRIVKWP